MTGRRLRLGMVGGGTGAFIGAVHRLAARMDDRYVLTAGVFSSREAVSRETAAALHLPADRVYDDFEAMAAAEAARPDGVEVVAIVTPNHLHYAPARAFVSRGVPVLCDKPLTSDLAEAAALSELVRSTGVPFGVTYNYSGYPLIRLARALVAAGEIGAVRVVQLQYAQDWLAEPIEQDGQKQAAWRTDPAKAGPGGSLGDIGTHAAHLAKFVTSLPLAAVSADLTTFVPGRRLDDNAHLLLRFEGDAKGMLWTSQVAYGHANDLELRVYGERGALQWRQEEPESLALTRRGEATQMLKRGTVSAHPAPSGRVPGGHPEGYLEAFATLYSDFADQVLAWQAGSPYAPGLVPTAEDGVDGLRFVEAAVRSSRGDGAWTSLKNDNRSGEGR
jgi:predicted dehydrogenase